MQLYYLDRSLYREKNSSEILKHFQNIFGDFYLLPEGGTNELAVKGCSEIIDSINIEFDHLCCPCGTGGTLAGLISGLRGKNFVLGFAVLKGASFLKKNVSNLLQTVEANNNKNWDINLDYHFGGYAKVNKQLFTFVDEFFKLTKIPIEPIYTGKMLFGIYNLISNGYFKQGSRIIALHTGGLQGLKGLREKDNS